MTSQQRKDIRWIVKVLKSSIPVNSNGSTCYAYTIAEVTEMIGTLKRVLKRKKGGQ